MDPLAANKKSLRRGGLIDGGEGGIDAHPSMGSHPVWRTACVPIGHPADRSNPGGCSHPNPAANKKASAEEACLIGGEGGIRTPGRLQTFNGFQDRRIRPLCHLSAKLDCTRYSDRFIMPLRHAEGFFNAIEYHDVDSRLLSLTPAGGSLSAVQFGCPDPLSWRTAQDRRIRPLCHLSVRLVA